jgi:hypothetical protein
MPWDEFQIIEVLSGQGSNSAAQTSADLVKGDKDMLEEVQMGRALHKPFLLFIVLLGSSWPGKSKPH